MSDPIHQLNVALEGRYRVEREVGSGGMATVYLADDLRHGRRVALKVLKPELAVAVGADRFLAEIQTTAKLQHPHILPLFDSGEADGFLFYVMPYVEGETLRQRLDRRGQLELDEALGLLRDLCAALEHAHARHVVHRDIKPANILLADGEALVADFGVARAVASAEGDRQLTATGVLVGTPSYMSPEQLGGERTIDARSDVYALGCLLYEMLAGGPPFRGATLQGQLAKTLTEPPPGLRDVRPEVTATLDAAIGRALAKRPQDRFGSAREFVDACTAEVGVSRSRPRKLVAALVALLVLVSAAAASVAWRSVRVSDARSSLAEVRRLAEQRNFVEAYALAVRAERWIAGDSTLSELLDDVSDELTIVSDPPGAEVFLHAFAETPDARPEPRLIGTTPIESYRVPRTDHLVTLHLAGFEPIERIASTELARELGRLAQGARELAISVQMVESGGPFPEMVAVPGGEYQMTSPDAPTGLAVELQPFLIDRFEVTNAAFKEFVDRGGYSSAELWSDVGAAVRAALVDRTGLPGPRAWTGQAHDRGAERRPVTGVSWFEANAFCRFHGKRLPTAFEWEKAARDGRWSRTGVVMPWGFQRASSGGAQRANFDGHGPEPVDEHPFGISPYGAYAMAGNVWEWTQNPLGDGRAVTGGSWDGPSYLFSEYASRSPDFASASLGFRCATSEGPGDQGGFRIDLDNRTPVYRPVNEATYRTLLDFYRYDPIPANPRGRTEYESAAWTRERLWIDGPGGDSLLVYFYRPESATPPYQTIVFVPGSNAFSETTVPAAVEWGIGGVVQAGRAVLAVVLDGMVERSFPRGTAIPPPPSVGFRDLMVRHATELRLGMDYAETRDDVDPEKFAFVGISFGAGSRLPFSAVDERYQAVVYIGGGIDERIKPTLPEADNVNFAPHVSVPKLLINGAQDEEHPWLSRALPLWQLLREPKELVLVEGAGHIVPPEHRIPAINGFLDRVLGPVRR